MDWEAVGQLVSVDGDLQETVAASTSAQVQAGYEGLDWYDHAAITAVAASAGQAVRAAAQTAVGMSSAYLTRVLREMITTGEPTSSTLRLSGPLRYGVASWASPYGRVADTVRFELSKGQTLDDAVKIGLERSDAMVRTDLALARRSQARATFEGNQRVYGYRRVVHPELSRTGTCGLCIAAADRRYNIRDLMPLHQRCKCTVLPITSGNDPGGAFDQDEKFAEAYRMALSNRAADLKEVRVRYEWNNELGPTLSDAEHRSTNPGRNKEAKVANEKRQATGRSRPAGQTAFAAMSRDQVEHQLRITQGLKDSAWRTTQLERLRARLRNLG